MKDRIEWTRMVSDCITGYRSARGDADALPPRSFIRAWMNRNFGLQKIPGRLFRLFYRSDKEELNEAFRAGNRARKKESAANTADGVIDFPVKYFQLGNKEDFENFDRQRHEFLGNFCRSVVDHHPDWELRTNEFGSSGTVDNLYLYTIIIKRVPKDCPWTRIAMTIVDRDMPDAVMPFEYLIKEFNNGNPNDPENFLYVNIIGYGRRTKFNPNYDVELMDPEEDDNDDSNASWCEDIAPLDSSRPVRWAYEYIVKFVTTYIAPAAELAYPIDDFIKSWGPDFWFRLDQSMISGLLYGSRIEEAFHAGNRARKKESAADAVSEEIESLDVQIQRFKKLTNIELFIDENNIPYYQDDLVPDCIIKNIPELKTIPDKLIIKGGSLYISDCPDLIMLPNGLSIPKGILSVKNCPGLKYLPNNMNIRYGIEFENCTGLTSFPQGLSVNGELNLTGCTGLTSLPDNLNVGKNIGCNLNLTGCTGLTSLPKGLSVGDSLDLTGCTGLTSLPADLIVGRDIYLKGCTGLTSFPQGITVPNSLNFEGCTGLTSLPKGLSVEDSLNLTGCTGLISLPRGMTVGDLNLEGCTELTSLPHGLTINFGHLYLKNCNKLTSLPSDLNFEDDFSGDDLKFRSIFDIPDSLMPFIEKLGIPVIAPRVIPNSPFHSQVRHNINQLDWMKKRHLANKILNANEAFKSGNRARKKESAADIVQSTEDNRPNAKLIVWANAIVKAVNEASAKSGIWTSDNFGDNIEIDDAPDEHYYMHRIKVNSWCGCIDDFDIDFENGYVAGYIFIYVPVNPDDGYAFSIGGACNGEDVNESYNIYEYDTFENAVNESIEEIIGCIENWNTEVTERNSGYDDDDIDEAFRAGNSARKKESVQDTVESVDNVQAQIKLFKEQTGKELEIKDGHPYFNGDLDLEGCTGLTSLPTGLKVRGDLYLEGCTGLTSLLGGLEVNGSLYLERCPGLTSLPNGLKVAGTLYLSGCTGLKELPDGLEIGGDLDLTGCTGLTGLPSDLIILGNYIIHRGILTSFFKKLRMPVDLAVLVDKDGDTRALYWRKWQKAHGYLKEAFRAGNSARKKESAADAVQGSFEELHYSDIPVLNTQMNRLRDLVSPDDVKNIGGDAIAFGIDIPCDFEFYFNISIYPLEKTGIYSIHVMFTVEGLETYMYDGDEVDSWDLEYVFDRIVDAVEHPEKFEEYRAGGYEKMYG